MAEFDIQGKITFDSTQATSALKGVSQAAGETAKQTAKVGEAAASSQSKIGQYGSTLGLVGQAAGQLSPALGSVVTVAGSATGVIQSLTTLGLGPLGLAIAGVSVAITAGVGLWKSWSDEQKRASESLKQNVLPTLEDLISKANQANQALATERRLARGGGTSAEQSAFLQDLKNRTQQQQTQFQVMEASFQGRIVTASEVLQRDTLYATIEANKREINRREILLNQARENERLTAQNEAALAAMQLEIEAVGGGGRIGPDVPDRPTGGGGRRGAAPVQREDPNAAAREAGEELDRLWAQSEQRLAERRARWAEEAAFQAELNQLEADEVRARLDLLERDEAEAEALREKRAEEHAQRMQEINEAIFNSLQSALASSVDAWLSGSRSMGEAMQDMVKAVAKSLASEAIIQGLKQTALGIGALAMGSPTAVSHFAAAGKWAAVGVAAGVVGAASGAFGGGGGGGGAGPAAATGGPALTAGAREGAGTTVVINWGSSGLVYAADRAQLGRDISGMISEANGRLGRGM